jgi:hypothetical protein
MRLIRIFVVLGLLIPLPGIAESNTTIGIGSGSLYGGVGVSVEQMLNDNVGWVTSLGTNAVDISPSMGINYYLYGNSSRFRYRLLAFYGFVACVTCENCLDDRFDKTFEGLSIGGGLTWEHFELSLYYRDISEFEDYQEELQSSGFTVDKGSETGLAFAYLF